MDNNAKNLPINQGITGTICKFCDRILANMNCESSVTEVMPLKDVTNTFKNICQRVDIKFLSSERGKELLNKAAYYKIPLDKDNINRYDLIDEVADYELLLEEANNLGIDWDISEYDPIALQQEIDYYARKEREAQMDLYHSFYNPRVLGV
jgi:hypothetical protein